MISGISGLVGVLGIWLQLCDRRNGFAPVCMVVGLIGLCVGGYFGK